MSTVRFGDIATSRKGKKPSSILDKMTDTHQIPYVDIKAFEKNSIDNYTDGQNAVLCEQGDLLLVWDGSRSGLVGKAIRGAIGSTLARIESNEALNSYMYYFLQSKFHELNTRQRGSGTPHVDPNILWNLEIYLPGADEQEKTIGRIEELLSELDKGHDSINACKKALVSYQQSVLNSLFAKEKMVPLGSLLSSARYGTSKKCGPDSTLTPVLRIPNIVKGAIDTKNLKYAHFSEEEKDKLSLKVGDLLVIRSNGSPSIVGKCAEVTSQNEGLLFAGYLIRLRFNTENHLAKFYKYLLSSPKLREQIEFKAKSTSGVNNINAEELKSLMVPALSLEEQNNVVKILDEKSSEIESLQKVITETTQRLNNLKQAVLSRAFKGELT